VVARPSLLIPTAVVVDGVRSVGDFRRLSLGAAISCGFVVQQSVVMSLGSAEDDG